MKELLIITTGGTIDKIYFDAKSDYQVGEPEIDVILKKFSVAFRWKVIPLMRKDSLELTDKDRQLIHDTISNQHEKHVLITHGTDSMIETAQVLKSLDDRVIVLTGALNPTRFVGSDAIFNIGCALGTVQSQDPGVYIAMNGCVWDPDKVIKNREQNRFEPIER